MASYFDLYEMVDRETINIWTEWMKARRKKPGRRGIQKWEVVSKSDLIRAWKSYADLGFVRDEELVDDIAMQTLVNTAKIYVNTVLMGHTALSPSEFLDGVGIDVKDETAQLEDFEEFAVTPSGSWRISDQADKIVQLANGIETAKTSEERLVATDLVMNFVHQRSDLAESFVEGGRYTLSELRDMKPKTEDDMSRELLRRILTEATGVGLPLPARKKLGVFFSELGRQPLDQIPMKDILDELKRYDITLVEPDFFLLGRDGHSRHDLLLNGEPIKNSVLVLDWHKYDTGRYEVNAYLS